MKQIILMLLALFLFSCKDSGVNDQIPNGSSIIFEVEHLNLAWGFSYQGVMIDNEGKEYSYNPGNSIPYLYHADGFYTERELQSKYGHAKTYIKTIRSDSLNWSHNLAKQVTTSAYSDTTQEGADMGELTYSVYLFRPQVNQYQQIILKVEGDYAFYNMSQSAITLAAWLKQY